VAAPEISYAWLEDQWSESARAWAQDQAARTSAYLDSTGLRDWVEAAVTRRLRRADVEVPISRGKVSFQLRRAADEEQYSLWVISPDGERILIDAAELPGDAAITTVVPSPDGTLVAWASAAAGSDWQEIRIRQVDTGTDLPDVIPFVKWPQVAWLPGGDSFVYFRVDPPIAGQELLAANTGQAIAVHILGSTADRIVFTHEIAQWLIAQTFPETDQVFATVVDGTTSIELWVAPVDTLEFRPLLISDEELALVGADSSCAYVISYAEQPDGQILAVPYDGAKPRPVDVGPGYVDQFITLGADGYLAVGFSSCSPHAMVVVRLADGTRTVADLPDGHHVFGISQGATPGTFNVLTTTFGSGKTLFELDGTTGVATIVAGGATVNPYRIDHVPTTDSEAEIPLVIVGDTSAPAPTLLTYYGGYSIDFLAEAFKDWHQAWVDLGGVIAVAGIRGGSEYGDAWHRAAIREKKQRSFDDVVACAQHLIATGVTTTDQLGISGASNGGMVTCAVLIQHPELLGAAVPEVPVTDMLRFHCYTVGAGWIREFGDPDDPADREFLQAYSPLHNLRSGVRYPPTLVVAADHDDRVPPGVHAYRFTAALQEATTEVSTVHLRIEPSAGHSIGRRTSVQIRERSDILVFLADRLGLAAGDAHQKES
jgi:prolyl oligopeptidase